MAGELTGKLIADKYRVDGLLTSREAVEFYRGSNETLEKPITIAVLPTALRSDDAAAFRFLTDARVLAKVDHPNLLSVSDFGTAPDGTTYVIYEDAPGETLADAVAREGRLPVDISVDIARGIAHALASLHSVGGAHRGLDPSTVVVSTGSEGSTAMKVFGVNSRYDALSKTGEAERRPEYFYYIAPEIQSGEETGSHRADIYALGAILYEMLAGAPPFLGSTPGEVIQQHLEAPPPPLSSFRTDLPSGIEPVILKALSKDAEARYATADEFAADLAAAFAGQPTAAAAAGSEDANNNIWKTAFVVLAGISLLTIGLIYMTYSRQTDPTTAAQPDANGMPVQPINPATGVEEQNLSNLPPDYTLLDTNSNTMLQPGMMPGGDGYNPWANGGAPPPGAPAIPPGGQVIQVPQGQSPFMLDPNCILQPSGIYLCPVPVTPTPAPKPTPSPRNAANTNTNTGTAPAPTATPAATKPAPSPRRSPQQTPAPARTPAPGGADPNGGDQ